MNDLLQIILQNMMFWFNFIIVLGITIFIFLTNRKEYIVKEFLIQISGTLIILSISYYVIYTNTTEIMQTEFWGGKVEKATFEEKWTEEYDCSYDSCSGTGNDRTCRRIKKTCTTFHPDNFFITTSNKTDINISREDWNNYKSDFTATEEKVYRHSQTSYSKISGEGDVWKSYPKYDIPSTETHSYVNYIIASNATIMKNSKGELTETDKKYLFDYPKLLDTKYGNIGIDRVIGEIDSTTKNKYQFELDKLSIETAKVKEANLLLYFIKTSDRNYIEKIKNNFLVNKNDMVIVLGYDDTGIIKISDTLNFLGGSKFIIASQNGFEGLNINNDTEVMKRYSQILKEDWERKSMEEFKYLIGDIEIDYKWQFLIIFINIIFNSLTFIYFIRNK